MHADPEAVTAASPTLSIDDDGVGWLVFDDPQRSVNVLDEPTMRCLAGCLDEAAERAAAGELSALVIRSAKSGFIAGADIEAIRGIEDPAAGEDGARMGQAVFQKLADLPVPTIAAVHGLCVGGGVELSLACRHRVASDDASTAFMLPEVQLGILPAWGGTTRLPRLVGLQASLDMLLTGRRVNASKARRTGLVDEVLPAPILERLAGDFARERVRGTPVRRVKRSLLTRLLDGTPPGRAVVLRTARKRVLEQTGGHYPAPLRILDVLRRGLGRPVAASLELEARALGELIVTPVSKNL
ncbi:MAG: hypothetical protein D6701_12365, partial [Gemmatimonadetes bacterium]